MLSTARSENVSKLPGKKILRLKKLPSKLFIIADNLFCSGSLRIFSTPSAKIVSFYLFLDLRHLD
jgi:hypothetical protein